MFKNGKLSSRPIALIDDGTWILPLRRFAFDAGEDLEDLFTLVKQTSLLKMKTGKKKKNFE